MLGGGRIGGWKATNDKPDVNRLFPGSIDDLRIYSIALTEQQIAQLAKGEDSASPPTQIASTNNTPKANTEDAKEEIPTEPATKAPTPPTANSKGIVFVVL